MKRLTSTLSLSGLLFLAACGGNATDNTEQTIEATDSVNQVVDSVEAPIVKNWFDFYGLDATIFDGEGEDMGLPVIEPYYLEADDFYRHVAFYSPDSNHYVDMDSYGMELFRNDAGEVEYMGREVDIKVYISTAANLDSAAIQLLMCGTSCLPEAAVWKDNETVQVLGSSTDEETGLDHPTAWMYNVSTGAYTRIIANTPFAETTESYFNTVRLPEILEVAEEEL